MRHAQDLTAEELATAVQACRGATFHGWLP
jgi:hypothetical protein